jgi:hypothetical protein
MNRWVALLAILVSAAACRPHKSVAPPDPVLQSLSISPAAVSIQTGQAAALTCEGTWSDGSVQAVTAVWSSGSPAVTLSGSPGSGVTATGASVGSAVVTATSGALSAQRTVNVTAPPPTLTSIAVNPVTSSINTGMTVALTCLGTWSDGSTAAVAASWTNSNGTAASFAPPSGTASTITVTGVMPGSAVFTATVAAMQSQGSVTVVGIPTDPQPVFAHDDSGGLKKYPPAGGGAPTLLPVTTNGAGLMMDHTATKLFYLAGPPALPTLYSYNFGTGAQATIATITSADTFVFAGLDDDSLHRIYTQGVGTGKLMRFDPSNNTVSQVGTTGGGMGDLAIGSDDRPYYSPLFGAGAEWIRRHNLTNDTKTTWATTPSDLVTSGSPVSAGLAASDNGRFYTTDSSENRIFRHVDLNGDGDALDVGEQTVFATLPIVAGGSYIIYGISMAGGGTLLVNVEPWNGTSGKGIYWLRDLNGDGDAADANELVVYNVNPASNAGDGSSLAAPK